MRAGPSIAVVLMLAAGAVMWSGAPVRAGHGAPSDPAVADALERFSATDLDGERWTADRLRGRVVLLDFWATWCAPCLAELPRLQALRARHTRTDFEIIGISLDATSRRSFVSWLNRHRIDWPQIHERGGYGGATARLFRIDRLPATILVDRDGSIAAIDMRGEPLSALVEELVTGGTRTGARLERGR